MEKLNVNFASKTIEVAENETYLELLNRVCYLDEPNGNDVAIVYGDAESANEMAQTLVNMPVVAKYVVDKDGNDSLSGHEVYVDSDGDVAFGTVPIGTHTEVYIAEDDVTTYGGKTMRLPCIFAKQRIWKRNKNTVAAVRRLYDNGDLHNSWELVSSEYNYKDGIKYITKYEFLGNCFLGDAVEPAYGESAKVLALSSETNPAVMMVAQALALDVEAGKKEEEDAMLKEVVSVEETLGENLNEAAPEVSDTEDQNKPVKTDVAADGDDTGDPDDPSGDNTNDPDDPSGDDPDDPSGDDPDDPSGDDSSGDDSSGDDPDDPVGPPDEEGVEFTEDDNDAKKGLPRRRRTEASEENVESAALTDYDLFDRIAKACNEAIEKGRWCYIAFWFPDEKCVLVKVEPSEQKALEYVLFNYSVEDDFVTVDKGTPVELTVTPLEAEKQIASLNEAIVEANKTIEDMKKTIASLEPYREEHEQAEAKRLQIEHDNAVAELRQCAIDSNLFTEDELAAGTEISALIDDVNRAAVESLIAARYVESMRRKKAETPKQETETASVIKVHLDHSGIESDKLDTFKSWLGK